MIVCAELVGASAPFVEGFIAALGAHDRLWYAVHTAALSPEGAGVRYVDEAPSDRIWLRDAPSLLAAGVGACGSIAAAHYGWLRARGRPAWLIVQQRGDVWHVVVRTASGVWDPVLLSAANARTASA